MNKVIPLLAFSVLLLVPLGAQNAFAGPPSGFMNYVPGCLFQDFNLGLIDGEIFTVNNFNAFPIDVTFSGSIFGFGTVPPGNSLQFGTSGTGPFTLTCEGADLSSSTAQGTVLPIPVCGNNITDTGEQCDDGGESSTCDADCTFAQCGDSTVNSAALEGCDDGNSFDGDSCTSQCMVAFCGDGLIFDATSGGIEQCDDGNTADGDGCSSSCMVETGGGFDCGPKTEPIAGLCVPKLDEICTGGAVIEPVQMMTCIAQSMGSMIGGELLAIDTMALFIGAIGVNPVITGLVAITMGGVAAQAVWFVHQRRKKNE